MKKIKPFPPCLAFKQANALYLVGLKVQTAIFVNYYIFHELTSSRDACEPLNYFAWLNPSNVSVNFLTMF